MLFTILILLFTVIVVPILSFYFGDPLNEGQIEILRYMIWIVLGVIAYSFIVGELSRNFSQVDKLWSIVPIAYVWVMTHLAGYPDKMVFMASLVTVWGIRLTYNFARRGAYSWRFWDGEEDYRWEELRKKPGFNKRWVWMIFNLFFISFYQHTLIFLFTLPILTCVGSELSSQITWTDWILGSLLIACVILEYIADQQQYDFQNEKHRRLKSGEDLGNLSHGFVRSGLWKLVRHPNYAMEQSVWILFYGFSVATTGDWINWSLVGCLLLVILFRSSSDFSEAISARKYPEYKSYQRETPRFVPFSNYFRKAAGK